MRRVIMLVLAGLLLGATGAWAQTGCPADSGTAVAVNPNLLRAELPEQTAVLLDGSPAVTGYVLGWYAEGASAPTSTLPVAKTAFALVAGTTFCYDAALPTLTGVPLGQKYLAVLKAQRGTAESPWSAASNPFGFEKPAPGAPPFVRLRKQ